MIKESTDTASGGTNAAGDLKRRRAPITPTGYAWRRFRRHKLALAGLVTIVFLIIIAVFAPTVAQYEPNKINLREKEDPPSLAHWLGTDQTGRDVLSRIIYGARISLLVGFASAAFVTVLGTLLGAFMGYHGGVVDGFPQPRYGRLHVFSDPDHRYGAGGDAGTWDPEHDPRDRAVLVAEPGAPGARPVSQPARNGLCVGPRGRWARSRIS